MKGKSSYSLLPALVLVALFCSSIVRSYAQESGKFSSLPTGNRSRVTLADTNKILGLVKKASALRKISADSAIPLLNVVLEQSEQSQFQDGLAHAYLGLGVCSIDKGDYDAAEKYFVSAYQYALQAKFDNTLLVKLYNNIATLYIFKNQNDKAIFFYYTALEFIRSNNLKSPPILSMIYTNLGIIWMHQDQYSQAKYYLEKSIAIAREAGLREHLAMAYVTLGGVYIEQTDTLQGRTYSSKGLQLSRESGNKMSQYCALLNLGISYQNSQPDRSLQYFKEAIRLGSSNPYYSDIDPHIGIGTVYFKLGNYTKAKKYLIMAINNAQTSKLKSGIKDASQMLALLSAESGDYEEAYKYQKLHAAITDSLINLQQIRANHDLEVKYRTAEKDKQIAVDKARILYKDNLVKKKNIWLISLTFGCLLFGALLLLFYMKNQHRQRLQKEKMQNLLQEQEIGQLNAMIKGEEKERTRIGRELHDGIGGLLATFSINFNEISKQYVELQDNETYKKASRLLSEISSEVRKTSHNMMPEVLIHHSLPEAVRLFCDYVQNAKGDKIQIDTQHFGSFEALNLEFTLATYRIIQELIQNIIKHSDANHALVQLILRDEVLSITVEDNGKGFSSDPGREGLGLLNIQSRVKGMLGCISIDSQKNCGTTVTIEFNLRPVETAIP